MRAARMMGVQVVASPGGVMFGIRAGRAAFDGERVVPGGALVLVDDGRIAGVEPGAAPAPEDCQVLDVPGGTVLPGLVDAHVHLCADGTDGTLDRIGEPGERWNLPDLDQFRLDKIIEIDTEPAASASPKPQHRQRAAGHLGSQAGSYRGAQ
jgi:hypothetical protein